MNAGALEIWQNGGLWCFVAVFSLVLSFPVDLLCFAVCQQIVVFAVVHLGWVGRSWAPCGGNGYLLIFILDFPAFSLLLVSLGRAP